jgi:hypothetical protein
MKTFLFPNNGTKILAMSAVSPNQKISQYEMKSWAPEFIGFDVLPSDISISPLRSPNLFCIPIPPPLRGTIRHLVEERL